MDEPGGLSWGGCGSTGFHNRRARAPVPRVPPPPAPCSPTRPGIRRVRQVRVGGSAEARRSGCPRAGSVRWRAAPPDRRPRPGGVRPPARPWPALPPGYAGCERGRPWAGPLPCRTPGPPSPSPDEPRGNRGGEPPRPHLRPTPRPHSLRSRTGSPERGRSSPVPPRTPRMPPSTRKGAAPVPHGGCRTARDRRQPGGVLRGAREVAHGPLGSAVAGSAAGPPGLPGRGPRGQSLSVVVESPCVTVARWGMHPVCMFEGERSSQRAGGGYDKASGRTRLRGERARPDT
ncbi:hypothetical protein SXANM310S_01726 [Streptomyces xanthochromogenes]